MRLHAVPRRAVPCRSDDTRQGPSQGHAGAAPPFRESCARRLACSSRWLGSGTRAGLAELLEQARTCTFQSLGSRNTENLDHAVCHPEPALASAGTGWPDAR